MPRAREIDPAEVERLRGLIQAGGPGLDRREKLRIRGLLQYATPESRRRHGELTRERMAAPEVRQQLRDAATLLPQLVVLREAWRNASVDIRARFLAEIARAASRPGCGPGVDAGAPQA
jgi:hypothetical protein